MDSNKKSESNDVHTVDLRSDTVTIPTLEMRKAMSEAIVGDDVYGEDPTVIELEKRSANIFGKEAGLFVPTGTMANLLAIMVHCNGRGVEAITGDMSHIFLYEQGGAAHIAGVQLTTIKNLVNGTFCLEELKKKIRGFDDHEPITKLVCVENTHNMCGGKVLPLEWLDAVGNLCQENNLKLHMDGARVFNAAEFLKVSPAVICKKIDSVCFCLSKGLSAPVGSILIGTEDFIKQARRLRKALGGGMRQVGVLAAAGIIALDQIVPKLGEDHLKTRKIAEAIHNLNSPSFKVDISNLHTNILMIQLVNTTLTSSDFSNRLSLITEKEIEQKIIDNNGKGIILKLSARDWSFARIVVYTQITDEDVELAIKKIAFVIREFDN